MQKTSKFVFPAIIFAMIVTAFAFYAFSNNVRTAVGSAPMYESYKATTTSSAKASGTYSEAVCLGECQLGSIVVNQVGTAGYVRVWNATSTATSTYASTRASTTASITWGLPVTRVLGSSDAAGTLVYDVLMSQGIVIETSTGFDGEYTVTFRK